MSEGCDGLDGRRQPIVAVLGHVDHGKTSMLDHIRNLGTRTQGSVMAREAGGITQHIGATEVPADILNTFCGPLLGGKEFLSPGLLFIDTPGHQSFTSLRSRGGALADIAILVIDVMDGCKPQTLESIRILRDAKTPFVIALNKVDRLYGWNSENGRSMAISLKKQSKDTVGYLEEKHWKLVGELGESGFNAERYDRIKDFTNTIAMVPCSAKEGEGVQDLLAVVIGLAERYLENQLTDIDGMGTATVLEVKEERGLGKTLDIILSKGSISKGDQIIVASENGPKKSKIRGMFSPRGMSEMRDAGDRWDPVDTVHAASGVKISAVDLDDVLAGTTLHVIKTEEEEEIAWMKAKEESTLTLELQDKGVCIKSDTLGGLEALAFELGERKISIRAASVGKITRKDIRIAEVGKQPEERVILAFNTKPLPEASNEFEDPGCDVDLISGDIIYHIIDKHEIWMKDVLEQKEKSDREMIVYPGRLLFLPDHTFRASKPAVIGVRVLGGRVHLGQRLMKDGVQLGQVKSIRLGQDTQKDAKQGDEVAIGISGAVKKPGDDSSEATHVTVGRQINEGDVLLVDVPESHVRILRKRSLTEVEKEILDEIVAMHRKDPKTPRWGL
ncbi:MAG: translation initiation factor IF-2 [Candidatus Thalassarchaeaceae archaeon]|nr:MAG: translation initiation factor IF-2 [Euryarchaeota archaeon]|tara:strand:+ start:41870 stop:43717 length:1848 start_codon:yes stop_codon:yes gene_type:complete